MIHCVQIVVGVSLNTSNQFENGVLTVKLKRSVDCSTMLPLESRTVYVKLPSGASVRLWQFAVPLPELPLLPLRPAEPLEPDLPGLPDF
jgi:hypothetical protein